MHYSEAVVCECIGEAGAYSVFVQRLDRSEGVFQAPLNHKILEKTNPIAQVRSKTIILGLLHALL